MPWPVFAGRGFFCCVDLGLGLSLRGVVWGVGEDLGDLGGEVGEDLAFPEGEGLESEIVEVLEVFGVAVLVALDFFFPEGGVGFGEAVGGAVLVSVPEASVDEDGEAGPGDVEVGCSGEAAVVFPVAAESGLVEGFAEGFLGFGASASVAAHGAAGFFSDDPGFAEGVEFWFSLGVENVWGHWSGFGWGFCGSCGGVGLRAGFGPGILPFLTAGVGLAMLGLGWGSVLASGRS